MAKPWWASTSNWCSPSTSAISITDTLRRYQVEALNPEGEPFNPEQHQAMAMQESASAEPGSVLKVFQKGYLLNGRLLRPAMVVVSKAPAETPPSIDEQA